VNTRYPALRAEARPGIAFDQGLRRHMLGIYNHMGLGLAITGLIALSVAATPAIHQPIFGTPLKWLAIFAPLGFVLFLSFRIERMTIASARTAFYAFSAVMGVSLASIFLVYTGTSIAQTFFIAASMFLAVSLWGYTTRRDLIGWTVFLFMGLIGVVTASLANLFFASSTLQLVVSLVGILVFAGLTAWDTQRLKSEYLAYGRSEAADKLAIMGALSLYLNFINMFQLLLGLMGERE
jgi:FtsH-binding integral membrane protein